MVIDMPLISSERKVTGTKFVITLPQDWRGAHDMSPGQVVTAYYQGQSPLVIVPKSMQLSQFERDVISLLVEGPPSMKKLQELIGTLDSLTSHLNKIEAEVSVTSGD